ncbi:hypothetical protein GCM10027290_60820 [Micromonospora sonneratiae]|uniref:Secreted protein n=1 Tax=Micromonospora sonneratiae TaxID=1184706 RepID=A0ABW3YHA7_9ACTN
MKTRSMLSAIALVGAAVGATIALTATPASAADTAYLEKTQYLTSNPTDGMATSCTSKRIELAAGNYTWGNYRPGSFRDQYLGATTYTWTTCLDPKNGYYLQTTTLDPDQSGWATATISDNLIISPSGTWTWGSYIDPHF